MRKKPEIRHRRSVARSRLFHIEAVGLRFSNGVEMEYERIASSGTGGGAVLVVPMIDDETVILISEYAVGTDRYELALPKGRVEPNEDVCDAANRELMEEIGHGAEKLTRLRLLTTAPGYLQHRTNIVLAQNLYPQRLEGDEPEPIDVVPWKLADIHLLLEKDEFSEARSVAALFMVREHLAREKNQT
ncbi:ADP compounds hydrolase NudE [Alkalilimnicola ehrlichii]|uniref:ADP compounds hydrolase NudE n=1 Tax=Alkalilimnicola ehrlichii TaxID=351052 RepID=A0A3E0X0Y3_9GAMM|nr:ADP compounds hydrolase NudE [Alkalilimnicola ehrlichii]RFA31419.1 ADP compounds hydrolase NudE [Alkalilimnicola ehrlichii]RFA39309.1 ADP compounds hydrolase NudE [Alkalilimnicola ehrlichii]